MLSTTLRKLSEQALKALNQPNTQRFCRPELVQRLRPVVRRFKYDTGVASFTLEPRYVERKEWGLTDQYRFINQEIKALSSYTYCSEAIVRSFNISPESLEPRLTRYLQVLLSNYFLEQDKSVVGPLSRTFLNDLEGGPIHWRIKGAIRGVVLDANQCQFGKYLLRRPVAGDFEVEQRAEDAAPHPLHASPPSAVLEFETSAPDHYAVRQEYAGILNLLRVFRLGSVRSVALGSIPHSVVQTAGVLYSAGPARTPYIYTLGDADQAVLDRFLEHHLSCVTRLNSVGEAEGKTLNCLAHKIYTLAVLGQEHPASQLLSALACLEALLLRREERADANCAHRLGRRLSNLLRDCAEMPEPVTGLLQQAYGIRNTYGQLLEATEVERRSLTSVARSILDYARITLVAFLRAADRTSTEALIERLDGGNRSTPHLPKGTDIPL
jgi:hypothetical protein